MGEVVSALPIVAQWLLRRYPQLMLAGGFVRDILAGLKPRDLDLCIVGEIEPFDPFGAAMDANTPSGRSLAHMLAEPGEWHAGMVAAAEWASVEGVAVGGASDSAIVPYPPVDLAGYSMTESDRAITLHPRSGAFDRENHQIQIIRHVFADPAELFRSFDFTVCQAGLRFVRGEPQRLPGFEIFTSEGFAADLPIRRLRFIGEPQPARGSFEASGAGDSMVRALRFLGRGHGWRMEPEDMEAMARVRLLELAGMCENGRVRLALDINGKQVSLIARAFASMWLRAPGEKGKDSNCAPTADEQDEQERADTIRAWDSADMDSFAGRRKIPPSAVLDVADPPVGVQVERLPDTDEDAEWEHVDRDRAARDEIQPEGSDDFGRNTAFGASLAVTTGPKADPDDFDSGHF